MSRSGLNAPVVSFALLYPAISLGLPSRTFVGSTGMDSNPYNRTAPCRSFTAAEAQTAPGGSVVVLDSAGYGPVTIGQSISLIAPPGVYAGITVPGWNGIIITSPAARCAATSSVYGVAVLGRTTYTPRRQTEPE